MPSPFPGLDPFIEGQEFETFHTQFITEIGRALAPQVAPHYVVLVERTVQLADEDDRLETVGPDVGVARHPDGWIGARAEPGATFAQPVRMTAVLEERPSQHFIEIRDSRHRRLVTVIELLSPKNKSPGEGARDYDRKRRRLLDSPANLVEIDLLRGGRRVSMVQPFPPGDYFALVFRSEETPEADVYGWLLSQPLPAIPVPLAHGDADAALDLQRVFVNVYDGGQFQYLLDYTSDPRPPLPPADREWVERRLSERLAES